MLLTKGYYILGLLFISTPFCVLLIETSYKARHAPADDFTVGKECFVRDVSYGMMAELLPYRPTIYSVSGM